MEVSVLGGRVIGCEEPSVGPRVPVLVRVRRLQRQDLGKRLNKDETRTAFKYHFSTCPRRLFPGIVF